MKTALFTLAASLALTGCVTTSRLAVDAPPASVVQQELVAEYGHVVVVRFENARAYNLIQKALFWRGRAVKELDSEGLSQSQKLDYLLGVDTRMDIRDDADLFISEEEAKRALEAEFQRARRELRLDYLAVSDARGVSRVAE